jgi:hypothetical protein
MVEPLRHSLKALGTGDEFKEIPTLGGEHVAKLKEALSAEESPERAAEEAYVSQYPGYLNALVNTLKGQPTLVARAEPMVQGWLPTFIYMSDYRAFSGSAQLDQVLQRRSTSGATDEDKTLVMIMKLAGLDLDQEVKKGNGGTESNGSTTSTMRRQLSRTRFLIAGNNGDTRWNFGRMASCSTPSSRTNAIRR